MNKTETLWKTAKRLKSQPFEIGESLFLFLRSFRKVENTESAEDLYTNSLEGVVQPWSDCCSPFPSSWPPLRRPCAGSCTWGRCSSRCSPPPPRKYRRMPRGTNPYRRHTRCRIWDRISGLIRGEDGNFRIRGFWGSCVTSTFFWRVSRKFW